MTLKFWSCLICCEQWEQSQIERGIRTMGHDKLIKEAVKGIQKIRVQMS